MFHFKGIMQVLNLKVLIVAVMAAISTFFCIKYQILADFPLTIIATAIIFPVVFSIGGAYKRREKALDHYGKLKAHGRAIFFAARDWMEIADDETLERIKNEMSALFNSCRGLFTRPVSEMRENEDAVYKSFSNLSRIIREDLREKGLASGEVSRCNQFLSKMFADFELVKHIYQYRTPRSLRAFSDFFITFLPIIYGPYFAFLAQEFSPSLTYVMPVLFSVVLVSLDNIQEHLENPFDEVGEDDVMINTDKFIERLY